MSDDGGRDLVAFSVRGRRCALPLASVEQIHPLVRVVPVPHAPPVLAGLIDVHGAPVPVFDLSRRMDGAAGDYGLSAKLVLGRTTRRPFAILANAVEGVVQVPAESIAAMTVLVPGAGQVPDVATGADGLIFIHDPEALLTAAEEADLAAALARRPE
jgi:purine-binding chemotaxis protein CheW